MPEVHTAGQHVKTYRIVEQINAGAMALSYRAHQADGGTVFLKQYVDPSVIVPWYPKYVQYQEAMKRRVEDSPFKNFTYRMIEFFEYDNCYYQAIEFVDASQSLENRLEHAASGSSPLTWHQRLTMAKVMVGAIKTLHAAEIVHSDLKPANVILIDSSSRMGYQLKLIDLDFSLLADLEAPWHGDYGYFGTPGYFSPEHVRGEVAIAPSDMFTCAIMLYLLLSREGHPYAGDDYDSAALAHSASLPTLLGAMPTGNDETIREMIHSCLDPRNDRRPTAAALHQELCREAESQATPSTDGTGRLVLRAEGGAEADFGISAEIGMRLCQQFGSDAQYLSEPQFHLEREGDQWFVVPSPAATNQTMLNGEAISEKRPLTSGDVLAVGNEAKGIVKLPLTVDFR